VRVVILLGGCLTVKN